MIGMDVFILNMEKLLRQEALFFERIFRNPHHSNICRKKATGNKYNFGKLNGGMDTVQQTLVMTYRMHLLQSEEM